MPVLKNAQQFHDKCRLKKIVMLVDEMLWHWEIGVTAWETSHRCWIMRKVIRKEVGAGGRFDFFWPLGLIEIDISRDQIVGAERLAGSAPKIIPLLP